MKNLNKLYDEEVLLFQQLDILYHEERDLFLDHASISYQRWPPSAGVHHSAQERNFLWRIIPGQYLTAEDHELLRDDAPGIRLGAEEGEEEGKEDGEEEGEEEEEEGVVTKMQPYQHDWTIRKFPGNVNMYMGVFQLHADTKLYWSKGKWGSAYVSSIMSRDRFF